jgi:5'-phosphate synthase pdxT subunit
LRPRRCPPRNSSRSGDGERVTAPRVGVLSLQGDFARHRAALERVGAEPVRVSLPEQLADIAALVIPGGESTTILRLLETTGLREPLGRFVAERPVLGTCAGLILLAREAGALPAPTLGALDVTVERNAYGRQIDSFSRAIEAPVLGGRFDGVFIRAPRIRRLGAGVEVVALDGGGEVVGVRQGHVVGLAFHPEMTADVRFHRWFLEQVAGLRLADAPAPDPAPRATGERT